MPTRPPISSIIIYAIGQFGWSLAAYPVTNLLIHFYMSPENQNEVLFPPFVYQGAILWAFTLIGLISFGGRMFDGITDPLIANYSDRMIHRRMGKRKRMMAVAALPFAILSFLIFFPIVNDANSLINSFWLVGSCFLFFLFMTMYVVPYTALIGELGHHKDDRMRISTAIAITWALGFVVGGQVHALHSLFTNMGMSSVAGFQTAVGIFACISFVLMMIPVFFLNEKKYSEIGDHRLNEGPLQSIRQVWKDKNFRYFTLADFMYWVSITFIQVGISYYVVTLLELDKGYASLFLAIGFVFNLFMYLPLNVWLVPKYGKKKPLALAFIVFSLVFALAATMKYFPIENKFILLIAVAILASYPMACFGIIPNAIIADMVYQNELNTGEKRAGMYFAFRAFVMKVGISFANLIFPSFLLLGKSVDNPLGVQMTAVAALLFSLLGFFLFSRGFKEVPSE